jgi:hypothetical protein
MSAITRILKSGLKVVTESYVHPPQIGKIGRENINVTLIPKKCSTTTTVYKPDGSLLLKRQKLTSHAINETTPEGKILVAAKKESTTLYPVSKQGEKEILAKPNVAVGLKPLESVEYYEKVSRFPNERVFWRSFTKPYSFFTDFSGMETVKRNLEYGGWKVVDAQISLLGL